MEAVGDGVVLRFVREWHERYSAACPVSAICFDLDLEPSEASEALDRLVPARAAPAARLPGRA